MSKKNVTVRRRMRLARKGRTRTAISNSERVMLTVYRSSKHTYAQLVDGSTGNTLATASTRSSIISGGTGTGNVDAARKVGAAIAELAKAKNIEEVVFNRNGFLFHGRIKAVADGAREAGLRF